MKTWNDYKVHVRSVDPEVARDIDEAENISTMVSLSSFSPEGSAAL